MNISQVYNSALIQINLATAVVRNKIEETARAAIPAIGGAAGATISTAAGTAWPAGITAAITKMVGMNELDCGISSSTLAITAGIASTVAATSVILAKPKLKNTAIGITIVAAAMAGVGESFAGVGKIAALAGVVSGAITFAGIAKMGIGIVANNIPQIRNNIARIGNRILVPLRNRVQMFIPPAA